MSEPDPIDARFSRLENRVADVHQLARRTDREVSSWRGVLRNHTEVLNAVGERLAKVETEMREVKTEMREVKTEMREVKTEVRDGFGKVGVGMAQITALLTNEINRRDET